MRTATPSGVAVRFACPGRTPAAHPEAKQLKPAGRSSIGDRQAGGFSRAPIYWYVRAFVMVLETISLGPLITESAPNEQLSIVHPGGA